MRKRVQSPAVVAVRRTLVVEQEAELWIVELLGHDESLEGGALAQHKLDRAVYEIEQSPIGRYDHLDHRPLECLKMAR